METFIENSLCYFRTIFPGVFFILNILNSLLLQIARESHPDASSLAFSSIPLWRIRGALNIRRFEQPETPVNEEHVQLLLKFLACVRTLYRNVTGGNEATRLSLLSPLLCFVFSLDPDIELLCEQNISGTQICAHGRFELMFMRGGRIICIGEVKTDDNIENGISQAVVGCQVAKELSSVTTMHGIVTNYKRWCFIRSTTDRVEVDQCQAVLENTDSDEADLRIKTGKVRAMTTFNRH